MRDLRLLHLVLLAVLVCACRPAPEEHAHHDEEAPRAEGSARSEPLALAGLHGIRIVAAPEPRDEGAWFPGEAIGDEAAQRVLSSPIRGVVASTPAEPGTPVQSGTELLRIASPELSELHSRRAVARANLERAQAALAREEQLRAAGATSERELEDARRELAVAAAEDEAARFGLLSRGLGESDRSGTLDVRAPAAGAVVRWNVRRGQGIEAGAELGVFQAASASLVRVDLTPPGPRWRLGDETAVRASDGRRWKAKVRGVPAVLDERSGRLTFRLALTEGAWPLPGQPVEVRVPFEAGVILPQVAVQQVEGTWGVFVRSGEHALFRPVRRGAELGSHVVIEDGVRPGEEVVTEGAYLLKSLWLKSRSGGEDDEH